MTSPYPEGSAWRRWDVHIHTPESVLRSGHPTWDEYLSALEKAPPEVCAIGATDYGSIAGYERLKFERESNARLKNFSLVLPNIELRMTPHHQPGQGINVHLLFDVIDPDHVERINTALARLTYSFQDQPYGCFKTDLIRLGKAFKPSFKSEAEAYREGLNQFRPSFQDFRSWYLKDSWVVHNSMVIVDNGSDDGVSNLQDDGGYKAERDEIYRFADAIFSSTPSDTTYFLGQKQGHDFASLTRRYGGLKACICGSDTSKPDKLFKPDKDRFCWIKADPTFAGLKQIIFEPGERVHIGPTYPEERDANRIMTKLALSTSGRPEWLQLSDIPLNPGLVAIIGNKGTGKTALVDLVAHATGSWAGTPSSFITKSHIQGLGVTVAWKAGPDSTSAVGKVYNNSDQRTKYLSQQFVEELCANNLVGEKLRAEIESVIFQHLGTDLQLGTSGFPALRGKRTNIVRDERQSLWESTQAAIADYVRLLSEIAELPSKEQRVQQLKDERAGLQSQIPKLDSAEQEANAEALAAARDRQAALSSEIAALLSSQHDLETVRSKVQRFQRSMDAFFSEISQELAPFKLDVHQLALFKPAFSGDTASLLDQKSAEIRKSVEQRRGSETDTTDKDTLHGLQKKVDQLANQSSLDLETKKRIEALQQRLRELAASLSSLEQEINEISSVKIPQKNKSLETIYNSYRAILTTFATEHTILKELYAPLSDRLSKGAAPERRLVLVINREVDLKGWAERGDDLIDHSKRGPYKSFGTIQQKAEELLLPHLISGDADKLITALQQFLETLTNAGFALSDQLKSGSSQEAFYEWLFAFQHVSLRYSIKYNGINLAQLSPGTKGLILLMLYLEMDENDRRPLLVDQPEENLDNESIYETLRGYFRRAKRRRQIILVTHNPNLVVNTDADQVIVACATESEQRDYPTLSYVSGSLENSSRDPANLGIREKVCAILEGGTDAFRNRERRYTDRHR